MMYPRLQLLKELLRDDGAIFVSIDDNEVHHLRMLMDEVFGEDNFLSDLVWQKKYAASNDADGIAPMYDHTIAYRRSEEFVRNLLPRTAKQDSAYKNLDDDERGPWKSADYTCNKTREERPNLYYGIPSPSNKLVFPDERRVWAYSEDVCELHLQEKRLWWGKEGRNSQPALKNFLSEVQGGLVPSSWLPHEDVGHTDEAKKELQRILGSLAAGMTPKPVDLLRRIVRIAANSDDIILDSFAGSGTTAHAVTALNKEDGGNRRFVLVQQPHDTKENEKTQFNICEKITAERVRRVSRGYSYKTQKGKTEKVAGRRGGVQRLDLLVACRRRARPHWKIAAAHARRNRSPPRRRSLCSLKRFSFRGAAARKISVISTGTKAERRAECSGGAESARQPTGSPPLRAK